MAQQPTSGAELVLYDELPLERVTADELITQSAELIKPGQERVYVASELVIGNYGVAGCLMVDSRPEQRWSDYVYNSEGWHPPFPESLRGISEEERLWGQYDDLVNRDGTVKDAEKYARFIGTASGFKMIRVFLTPQEVASQLTALGKHIGPALIQECFTADDVASDIPNEEIMQQWPEQGYGWDDPNSQGFGPSFESKVEALENLLQLQRPMHDYYVSFHGWPWHQKVIAAGNASLYKAISKFDALIASFDRKRTIATRELGTMANSDTKVIESH